MAMKDFRELKVWAKAHEVALQIYRVTKAFPKDEIYGLTSQIRRSSVSVASNIAEGCGRGRDTEFARFLEIAMGSANELDYQLLLSRDLSYLDLTAYEPIQSNIIECKKMLVALTQKLKQDANR